MFIAFAFVFTFKSFQIFQSAMAAMMNLSAGKLLKV